MSELDGIWFLCMWRLVLFFLEWTLLALRTKMRELFSDGGLFGIYFATCTIPGILSGKVYLLKLAGGFLLLDLTVIVEALIQESIRLIYS